MSMNNSNDTIGNRTRDLPDFGAVPQPTAPPRAPHLRYYLAEFFFEWEMLQKKFVQKIKTHIMFKSVFPRKSRRLWDNVKKYGRARQATDDNIIRYMFIACWITKATDTLSEYIILIALPRQQWLRERASILRYTYIASFLACLMLFVLYSSFLSSVVFVLSVLMCKAITLFLYWCHSTILFRFTLFQFFSLIYRSIIVITL